MRNVPPRRTQLWILGGGLLLLLAAWRISQLNRDAHADQQVDASAASSQNHRPLAPPSARPGNPIRPSRAGSPRRDPQEWLAEVVARHPGLEPTWRKVPDHENGFLQWLAFSEQHKIGGKLGSETLDLPADITAILSNPDKWDAQTIASFLAANQELLETITRIGLLPSQSVAGVDTNRWHFVGARLAKQSSDLLLADARLAAEAGDSERALRRVQAVSGLAGHHDQVEAPSLLMESVSMLLRWNAQEQVMNHLLPALDPSPAEVARWREAIRPPDRETTGFSSVLRGEAWVGLSALMIPALNGDLPLPPQLDIPDPDALLDCYVQSYLAAATRVQSFSLDELAGGDNGQFGFPFTADHLSEGARELLDLTTNFGASAWAKGWARDMVLSARADAALAIMQGQEIPLEPFTGLPFVHDRDARTLQVPNDPRLTGEGLNIGKPLKLP